MSTKTLNVKLRPKFQKLRDERTYMERDVKKILFNFARGDLGCEWPAKRLREFIDTVFDFD
jgi:hypothetical protein